MDWDNILWTAFTVFSIGLVIQIIWSNFIYPSWCANCHQLSMKAEGSQGSKKCDICGLQKFN